MESNKAQKIRSLLGLMTIEEVIAKLKRESSLRNNVYPKFVASGKMSEEDSVRRKDRLNMAIKILLVIEPDVKTQLSIFDKIENQ